ncbi:hypothetical protein NLJ89_g2092 [Agrocybe chaxingu]|uniref:Small RNA 2'-O-methyltransferase n=1 Tax=Agrocybe chaxingu TaxID=84603 RepID=A0A9W8K6I4_9AGAR|nr:hypothetical protein NLJ89_g2092 [Agrocybe chaxingu]
METTRLSDNINETEELKVTFYPELFLQRRIWILNFLRKENVTRVLDVGCGEGQLLTPLCQPAPWLTPPPPSILPPPETPSSPDDLVPSTPTYNDDDIPNLHLTEVHGLDISSEDLAFAMEACAPPKHVPDEGNSSPGFRSYTAGVQRWEELICKVWQGGLEVINEEFVDMECIVAMEVIEHLPDGIFQAFAPVLLGVYHPEFLLVTTPSYTFNDRFLPPNAPRIARSGYLDPTRRTDRIFRHSDHKFEWTRDEFKAWCEETAKEWGYVVRQTSIGLPLQEDPFGRDEQLEGATQVAEFRRLESMDNKTREGKGRVRVKELGITGQPHEALAVYKHTANAVAMKPKPLEDVAERVILKMEEFREAFMRVEELWFEADIAALCGGWVEVLVRAIEECPKLQLKRDVDGIRKGRSMWSVELIGGVANPAQYWPAGGETNADCIPADWSPVEDPEDIWEESDFGSSTGVDGDISANTSEDDGIYDSENDHVGWRGKSGWKGAVSKSPKSPKSPKKANHGWSVSADWGAVEANWGDVQHSAMSSTAGWDGDESDGDTTS